jgi:membrane-bound lytic murein transglycosylase D
MEEPIPMTATLLRALAAVATLTLAAGCATVSEDPTTTMPAVPVTPPAPATPPAPVAAAPEPAPALAAAPDASQAASSAPAAAPVVTAVPVPVDPLHPDRIVDTTSESARTDLWDRIRRGFAIPNLETDLVRQRERGYAGAADYVGRMTDRGSRYLYHIVEEVEKRGMPTELALLPFIESAFNPQAMSSARASGMWQFMPATGKHYDLTQNVFRDDRRDVLASTRAALDYLSKLHRMFGNWHLALAAYNWGEGNVQRAIARNRGAGLPTDYLSLSMPAETRHYVPKLQAMENIVADPDRFGLTLPLIENHPYFLSVAIDRDIDVELAARFAELPLDEFRALNPQLNRPVILAAGTPQLLLPYDNANAFVRRLGKHRGPTATWTAWVVPRTLKPVEAAQQAGMSEESMREVNRIPPRMLIRAGSTLLVPRDPKKHADVTEHLADNATMALAPDVPPMRRVTLQAGRKGDSVAAIARRYRVSASQVAQWNRVGLRSQFKAGQKIVVYVPQSGARARGPVRAKAAAAPATRVAVKGRSAKPVAASRAAKPARTATRSTNKKVRVAQR